MKKLSKERVTELRERFKIQGTDIELLEDDLKHDYEKLSPDKKNTPEGYAAERAWYMLNNAHDCLDELITCLEKAEKALKERSEGE